MSLENMALAIANATVVKRLWLEFLRTLKEIGDGAAYLL